MAEAAAHHGADGEGRPHYRRAAAARRHHRLCGGLRRLCSEDTASSASRPTSTCTVPSARLGPLPAA